METGGTQVALAKLGPVHVLALAAAGVAIGEWIRKRVPALERLSIPASIIGGLLFAVVILGLHGRVVDVQVDATLRDVFLLGVFTIIGLNASLRVIRVGGLQVAVLLLVASIGAVVQNAVGMSLAKLFGLNPLIGMLAGAVSLAGGPATSIAFGATFEQAGVRNAATIALASATFGITVSGLLAGTVGAWLIRRRGLRPTANETNPIPVPSAAPAGDLALHIAVIALAMGLGNLISQGIERLGFVLPGYIGAMIAAALIRNLSDWTRSGPQLSQSTLSALFDAGLPLFIVMAMLTLRLWELAALAAPMLVILAVQVAVAWLLSIAAFAALGRDFDAAVTATGHCGFMLGITASALATMGELTRRYGPSPRAFIVVPIVGAFLIDFTNSLIITATLNIVR